MIVHLIGLSFWSKILLAAPITQTVELIGSAATPVPYQAVARCYATYVELGYASTMPVPARKAALYQSEASNGANGINSFVDRAASRIGVDFYRYAAKSRFETRRAFHVANPKQMEKLGDGLYNDAIECDKARVRWGDVIVSTPGM